MKLSVLFLVLLQSLFFIKAEAQDLLKERIRKLSNNKNSIYIEKGVFHNGGVKQEAVLKSIRQSFNAKQGFERIVIDFNSNQIPKVYGHVSSVDKKIFIDFFETSMAKDFQTTGNKHFVEKINFFPIDANYLSTELSLKEKVTADIFFLENPARLVIDLKN